MKLARRSFLSAMAKGAGALALVMSYPSALFAKWHKEAFLSTKLDEAISLRYPGLAVEDSADIKLKAPAIAENGAVVPVSVKTKMAGVKSISLYVENNPSPLACSFNMISDKSVPDVSVRIRMGQTTMLHAIVEADGKLHRASQEVKVTIGGCGG